MAVEGESIVWKPSTEDLGSHSVSLLLTQGASQFKQELVLEVDCPNIALPFDSEGCKLSPDQSKLVVWGADVRWLQSESNKRRNGGPVPFNAFAVIDTKSHRVLVSYQARNGFKSATISNDAIYLQLGRLPSNSMGRMEKISLRDFKLEDNFEFPEGKTYVLQDLMIVDCGSNQGRMSGCFTLPDLKPVQLGSAFDPKAIPVPYSDYYRVDRVVFDSGLKERKLLLPVNSPDSGHSAFAEYSIVFTVSERVMDTVICVETASKRIVKSFRFRNEKSREGTEFYCLSSELLFITSKLGVRVLPNPISSTNKPFRIEPVQSTFVLSSALGSDVRYVADGATRFELTYPLDVSGRQDGKGTTLVSSTGEFSLDLRKEAAILFQRKMTSEKGIPQNPKKTEMETERKAKRSSEIAFQNLTGRKPQWHPWRTSGACTSIQRERCNSYSPTLLQAGFQRR